MCSHSDNFQNWYVSTLENLYLHQNTGFPILMIAFPLLERYLRHKSGLKWDQEINETFKDKLRTIFPVLSHNSTAYDFWTVFRHGLLHQVTFSHRAKSGRNLPRGILTCNIEDALQVDKHGHFTVNPKKFAKDVVRIIEEDFQTYVGLSGDSPNLPTEGRVGNGEIFDVGTSNEW